MAAKETLFECLACKHTYTAMFDRDKIQERQCPECRSNSVRIMPPKKAVKK